jgi:hypothetical protein
MISGNLHLYSLIQRRWAGLRHKSRLLGHIPIALNIKSIKASFSYSRSEG